MWGLLGWRWRPRSDRVHVGAASRRQRRGHRAAHLHVARANVDADCAAAATTDSLSCNNNGGPLRRGAPATRPPARPLPLPVTADDPAASRHERAHGDMTTSTAAVFTVFNLIDCSRGEEGLGGGIGGRAAADRHGGGCAAGGAPGLAVRLRGTERVFDLAAVAPNLGRLLLPCTQWHTQWHTQGPTCPARPAGG